ncbi:MAG: AAA family ATPase, partial [Planctomycetes bacterium]|nr:AAA family ATPase [Planctomycetota bacterium]
MILHSIRVEGWRCFAAEMSVGPFVEGLNIIHGPNGIGKSTLMTALVRGLFDSHTVTGEEIKLLRPWGRSLIPRVTIDFTQDDVRYRLHKQFLSSQTAQLSRLEDGRYVPLAESRDADEQARRVLAGDAPGRGVTDQRHWGLAQILWATQGRLQIDSMSDGTRATIQNALAAQITGPGAEAIEKQITSAYTAFFTPGGKLRGGAAAPAVVSLQSRLEAAREHRKEALERLDEFDAAVRRAYGDGRRVVWF